jgi:glucose/arabinose dehydrogenase
MSEPFVFVNYTDGAGDTVVARYRATPELGRPKTAMLVLHIRQPFENHNGGQLQFGPDGFLYVGMGDGGSGNDPQCNAQRNGTLRCAGAPRRAVRPAFVSR